MGWKSIPYWLRGGLIGGGLALIVFILDIVGLLGFIQFGGDIRGSGLFIIVALLVMVLVGFVYGTLCAVIFKKVNTPYWIRGALCGLISWPLFLVIAISIECGLSFYCYVTGLINYLILSIPIMIIVIVVGTVVGFIVGKIKSKHET